MTTDMLTYLDGGAHTCCVYDGEGNTGCDRTEIFIKGVCVVFVCVCVCVCVLSPYKSPFSTSCNGSGKQSV